VDEVAAYDSELVGRLRGILGDELVGVYVSGSGALGDYVPGRSDLDRFAVCERGVGEKTKEAVVAALRHESLPCPARGLELVLYRRAFVAEPRRDAAFELNLNSGAAMPLHVAFEPEEEARHWFVLDLAIVRDSGRALVGPPPRDLFAELPREWLLEALAESLAWHRANPDVAGENAVLNACRAWRFAEEGRWSSKRDAAAWARSRLADPAVVDAAVALRHGGAAELDPDAARALVERVEAAVRRSASSPRTRSPRPDR
jgi:Domain of unknown function (DUF4111)